MSILEIHPPKMLQEKIRLETVQAHLRSLLNNQLSNFTLKNPRKIELKYTFLLVAGFIVANRKSCWDKCKTRILANDVDIFGLTVKLL